MSNINDSRDLSTGEEETLAIQLLANDTLQWLEYAHRLASTGSDPAALVDALEHVGSQLVAINEHSGVSLQAVGGLTEALKVAIRQRDQALQDKASLETYFDDAVGEAVTEEVGYLMQFDPFLDEQRVEEYAEDMLNRGLEEVSQEIRERAEQMVQDAQERAAQLSANAGAVYVDDADPIDVDAEPVDDEED